MRIVTGKFRRKVLKVPNSKLIRPTREMVRKAIFDVLGDFVEDKDVLDLFSGSGALGFEALSNSASNVTFVDNNKMSVKVIRENIASLNVGKKCRIIARDVSAALNILIKNKLQFQIVLADPPYSSDLAKKCLLEISNYDILLPPTIMVIEHYKKDKLPETTDKFKLWQLKKYGDTLVSFYIPI